MIPSKLRIWASCHQQRSRVPGTLSAYRGNYISKVSTSVRAYGSARTWLVANEDGPLPSLNTLSCHPGTPGHR